MTAASALSGLASAEPTATYSLTQGDTCVPLVPLSGSDSVVEFYSYQLPNGGWGGDNGAVDTGGPYFCSAGTTSLQRAETSILFLYDGPNGLSLVIVHDSIDDNDSNGGNVTFSFSGMPTAGSWVVKDDVYLDPDTGEPEDTNYDNWYVDGTDQTIDWSWYGGRTDGGAYRGLGTDFALTISPAFNDAATLTDNSGTLDEWQALSGDLSNPDRISLDMQSPITIRSHGCGTAFGVATTGTSAVGDGSATLTGELSGLGDAGGATVYFEYWQQGARDSTTNWWTGQQLTSPGTFSADLTLRGGTTYEFRALAKDTAGRWKAGTTHSFTTTGQPFDVTTTGASGVDGESATLAGHLDGLGHNDAATVYFRYWQQGAEGATSAWWTGDQQTSPGSFSADVSLQSGTAYEFRALARGSSGAWKAGTVDELTTTQGLAVATAAPTNVGDTSATLGCTVQNLGSKASVIPYVRFWPSDGDESAANWWTGNSQTATGTYTATVSLRPGTSYNCRALVQAADGTWRAGGVQTFQTSGSPLAVTTDAATDVTATSATLSGELAGLGGADSATVYVTHWQQGAESTTKTWWTGHEQTAPTSFSSTVSLQPNTTYEFRALAQTSAGTWTAGSVQTVTTPGTQ
ncbi:MAG: hypothetical protein ABEI77_00300 [Halorientalis sp.]